MHAGFAPRTSLYAITPDWRDSQRLLRTTESLLQAGLRWLQYRDKSSDAARRLLEARALRRLTAAHGCRLIINDDLNLAQHSDADGVHLGEDDAPVEAARASLGQDAIIGLSCYNDLERVHWGCTQAADYLAMGAVHASPTKPAARRVTLSTLAAAASCGRPVCAIGGLTPANVGAVVHTGVRLIAVVSAVFEAADPVAALRAFDQAIDHAERTRA